MTWHYIWINTRKVSMLPNWPERIVQLNKALKFYLAFFSGSPYLCMAATASLFLTTSNPNDRLNRRANSWNPNKSGNTNINCISKILLQNPWFWSMETNLNNFKWSFEPSTFLSWIHNSWSITKSYISDYFLWFGNLHTDFVLDLGKSSHLDGLEALWCSLYSPSLLPLELLVQLCEAGGQCAWRRYLVDLTGLAQGGFDYVSIVIVVLKWKSRSTQVFKTKTYSTGVIRQKTWCYSWYYCSHGLMQTKHNITVLIIVGPK